MFHSELYNILEMWQTEYRTQRGCSGPIRFRKFGSTYRDKSGTEFGTELLSHLNSVPNSVPHSFI